VEDEELSNEDRCAAANDLITLRAGDESAAIPLLDVISPRTSTELASGLLAAIGKSETDALGPLLIDRLPSQTPAVRAAGIAVLLSRPVWTKSLVEALSSGVLAWSDLSLDQRRSLTDHPDRAIRARAEKLLAAGGVLPNPDRRKVLDELLPLASQKGDAALGKQVFLKQCAKCHVHGGEGARIGPDLTGMAVHPKAELLENILDPSRSVEGNFRVFTVATSSGQVLTGLLGSESKTAIELFDAEGKKHSILREDIDQLVASPKSLMPEGFEKQMTPQELADLLEFLTQRGKYLPLPLEKVATSVSTRGLFQLPDMDVERMIFDDWSPKQFGGVPFQIIDPRDGRVANAIVLHSPNGKLASTMPRSVTVPCHAPAKAIHLLGGVSGWGHPGGAKGSVSMIVRLHYADGATEDHELANGVHLADFIRRVDVPQSQFAFDLRGRQLRYLSITPQRQETIDSIELLKGSDATAPVVMAMTLESP
jgi:putative heme-binding domain-containing protein